MCGIAGFISQCHYRDGRLVLQQMTDTIRHRGPDDAGYFDDGYARLGHRRLSIVDLAGGHQPMSNEDGSLWITYNGEIFNHADLRPALEKAGHEYRSRCDTETIIHSFEQYGPECLQLYRGMFAFALWDKNKRRLFCARDRLGIKPLYYYWDGRLFAFASEIKALLAHPEISPQFNEAGLGEYLAFGYLSGQQTMFRGIRKLMPGHWLDLDFSSPNPQMTLQRYWDAPAQSSEPERDDADWIRETRQRLEKTVRMRLMSDVPLGMFLSGGVDSSAIAALIRRITPGTVKTFSVGYNEEQYSELNFASQVASSIGTEHHEVRVGMESFFNILPQLVWHEDEPIVWPSSVSLYFVSKLASEQVKVVLTGEGSDEIFGGYERYRWNLLNARMARAYKTVPNWIRTRLRSQIQASRLINGSVRRKLQHTFLGREADVESLFLDNFYCAFSSAEQHAMFTRNGSEPVYENYNRYWAAHPDDSLLARMLYADQKTYLLELLMKQDQMSMAASIESRVPFLDHTFVEFATRIPDRLKIRKGVQKYVLKKAVEDLLPRGIIYRKKMGFPTPIRSWLRSTRAGELFAALQSKDGLVANCLDLHAVNDLIARNRAGIEDCTDQIWRLLTFQIWGQVFITGNRNERWNSLLTTII
jgi:asparagine synthase (glutamine-hydrolysing)